jgi:hypothetical protein
MSDAEIPGGDGRARRRLRGRERRRWATQKKGT